MSLEEFIIWTYCCVDCHVATLRQQTPWRSRGYTPKLTDAEVITMEIVGEFLQQDTDKGIWQYFKKHWHHYFPNIGSRSNFAKHASNLWAIKQKIHERILHDVQAFDEDTHIIDGFPMPICHFRRAYSSQLFSDEEQATYGYCASKKENYYGFEGHIIISESGFITGYTVTKPNIEREASFDCVDPISGLLLGDKGYTGAHYHSEMRDENIQVSVPSKKIRLIKRHLYFDDI